MNRLLNAVGCLRRSPVKKLVDSRMREFELNGRKPACKIFNELCFCILTANFNAERAIEIQKKIGNGFLVLPEKKLAGRLRKLGYRYPNARAKYIVEARRHVKDLKKVLNSPGGCELRDWFMR
jgi:N-glycosylase/DNA lyase